MRGQDDDPAQGVVRTRYEYRVTVPEPSAALSLPIGVLGLAGLAAMIFGSGWVATGGQWALGLTFLAHVVEFVVHRKLFERAGGSMGHHFVQTMIYGLFHCTPIKERLESRPDA
jgi:hypothetical protein